MNKLYLHNFGADPEVFIVQNKELIDTEYGKLPKLIPPQALIQDYAVKPEIIDDKVVLLTGTNYQWSEDGAAIELQMHPTDTFDEFRKTINSALIGLSNWLAQWNMQVYKNPLAIFDTKEYWENRDESFRQCVVFGCDPDMFPPLYEDFGLDENNDEEIDVENHDYRYGGGHIHIQAPMSDPEVFMRNWAEAATVFDFTVGLLNVTKKRKESIETQEMARLEYYGRPGRIRLQEYDAKNGVFGIEYRVLSNYWVSNPSFMNKLLMTMDFAAQILEKELGEEFVEEFMEDIPDMYAMMLNRNHVTAKELLNKVTKWLVTNRIVNLKMLKTLSGVE